MHAIKHLHRGVYTMSVTSHKEHTTWDNAAAAGDDMTWLRAHFHEQKSFSLESSSDKEDWTWIRVRNRIITGWTYIAHLTEQQQYRLSDSLMHYSNTTVANKRNTKHRLPWQLLPERIQQPLTQRDFDQRGFEYTWLKILKCMGENNLRPLKNFNTHEHMWLLLNCRRRWQHQISKQRKNL